jgi:hypothetical protein
MRSPVPLGAGQTPVSSGPGQLTAGLKLSPTVQTMLGFLSTLLTVAQAMPNLVQDPPRIDQAVYVQTSSVSECNIGCCHVGIRHS